LQKKFFDTGNSQQQVSNIQIFSQLIEMQEEIMLSFKFRFTFIEY